MAAPAHRRGDRWLPGSVAIAVASERRPGGDRDADQRHDARQHEHALHPTHATRRPIRRATDRSDFVRRDSVAGHRCHRLHSPNGFPVSSRSAATSSRSASDDTRMHGRFPGGELDPRTDEPRHALQRDAPGAGMVDELPADRIRPAFVGGVVEAMVRDRGRQRAVDAEKLQQSTENRRRVIAQLLGREHQDLRRAVLIQVRLELPEVLARREDDARLRIARSSSDSDRRMRPRATWCIHSERIRSIGSRTMYTMRASGITACMHSATPGYTCLIV